MTAAGRQRDLRPLVRADRHQERQRCGHQQSGRDQLRQRLQQAYNAGISVTLTATPATGWQFASWLGPARARALALSSMTAAKSATATFKANPVLTVSRSGIGTVVSSPAGINCGSDCSEPYSNGTAVTLSATPASGYTFGGWSGACVGTGECAVTMTAAKSVTATFKAIPVHADDLSQWQWDGGEQSGRDQLWQRLQRAVPERHGSRVVRHSGQRLLFQWVERGLRRDGECTGPSPSPRASPRRSRPTPC